MIKKFIHVLILIVFGVIFFSGYVSGYLIADVSNTKNCEVSK